MMSHLQHNKLENQPKLTWPDRHMSTANSLTVQCVHLISRDTNETEMPASHLRWNAQLELNLTAVTHRWKTLKLNVRVRQLEDALTLTPVHLRRYFTYSGSLDQVTGWGAILK